MTLLLTGGTGFFGKALLRHWAAQTEQGIAPTEVTVLSRDPQRFLRHFPEFAAYEWLHFHQGDVLQPDSLPFEGCFTRILHAAADSTLGPGLPAIKRYDQIVSGTRHLLDFAVQRGIPRLLLVSSGGVYGSQPANVSHIKESCNGMPDILNPANAYGVAKRCAEHLCALYSNQYGLETVIARCFAFLGRDLPLDVHFAVGNLIRDALYSQEIVVSGDGTAIRSYMDQRDLATWLSILLDHGKAGHAYNVGSDVEINIRDLAGLVSTVLAPEKLVRILGKADPASARNRYVPCIGKARQELGLQLTFPLAEAILEASRHARLAPSS